jgi:hypothetical protein
MYTVILTTNLRKRARLSWRSPTNRIDAALSGRGVKDNPPYLHDERQLRLRLLRLPAFLDMACFIGAITPYLRQRCIKRPGDQIRLLFQDFTQPRFLIAGNIARQAFERAKGVIHRTGPVRLRPARGSLALHEYDSRLRLDSSIAVWDSCFLNRTNVLNFCFILEKHGDFNRNRMDRCNVEPGDGLHEGHSELQ